MPVNQEKQIKKLVAKFETELRRTVEEFENDGLNYINGFARLGKISLIKRSNQDSKQMHVFMGASLDKNEFPDFSEGHAK